MQTRSMSKRIQFHESPKVAAAAVMDANLWGTLPRELVLKVYNSLEIKEFYQLREVCKEWNLEACSRRCFNDPLPKPYFVMMEHDSDKESHIEFISYNVSSGTWMSKFSACTVHDNNVPIVLRFHRFYPIGDVMELFTVEGILFGKGCFNPSIALEQVFLFDVQVGQSIIDFKTTASNSGSAALKSFPEDRAIGMTVDTSKKPYRIKLVIGEPNVGTLILDSETRTWETRPSCMVRNRPRRCPTYTPKSCISCAGKVYIWADMDEIQVYSLAEDQWSTLDPPPRHPHHLDTCRGLGHWQEEVFAVTRTDELSPVVWKLTDSQASTWEKFERMPADLWEYLAKPSAKVPTQVMRIMLVNHSAEYLLMSILVTYKGGPKKPMQRQVLFSLANKRWERMSVPRDTG